MPIASTAKPVAVLSGGERARLMFLCMRLNEPNFLILDEPTNHIDIAGKESLETQLNEGGATLIITSHDRRFVNAMANRFVLISNRELVELDRAEAFYRQTLARSAPPPSPDPVTKVADAQTGMESDDALLERLIELETLLDDDLARNAKFQKPQRQAAWREEIDQNRVRLA